MLPKHIIQIIIKKMMDIILKTAKTPFLRGFSISLLVNDSSGMPNIK